MLIDISHFQGTVNWAVAKNDADGFYIKITEGVGYIDPNWRAYHDQVAGKPRGAYHFADLGDPVAEAYHFADVYLGATWELRPVLDIEKTGATAAWVTAFRAQFRKRVGSQPFRVYSGLSYLTGVLNPTGWIDPDTDIWAARYNATLGWDHPQLVLWQNTSAAHEPGFLGSVDTDQYMHGWTPAADQGADMPLTPADVALLLDTPIGRQGPGQTGVTSLREVAAWFDYAMVVEQNLTKGVTTAIQGADTDVKAAVAAAIHGLTVGNVDPAAFATAVAPLLAEADLAAFRAQFAK